MLAGIIPAPEYLSPYRDPSRGKKPQARTLRRMVEVGFLDAATAAAAVNEPLRLGVEGDDGSSGPWRAPYFVSEVWIPCNQQAASFSKQAIVEHMMNVAGAIRVVFKVWAG